MPLESSRLSLFPRPLAQSVGARRAPTCRFLFAFLPRQSVLLGLQKLGRRVLHKRYVNLKADDVAEAFGLEMVDRNGRQEVSEQKTSRAK